MQPEDGVSLCQKASGANQRSIQHPAQTRPAAAVSVHAEGSLFVCTANAVQDLSPGSVFFSECVPSCEEARLVRLIELHDRAFRSEPAPPGGGGGAGGHRNTDWVRAHRGGAQLETLRDGPRKRECGGSGCFAGLRVAGGVCPEQNREKKRPAAAERTGPWAVRVPPSRAPHGGEEASACLVSSPLPLVKGQDRSTDQTARGIVVTCS